MTYFTDKEKELNEDTMRILRENEGKLIEPATWVNFGRCEGKLFQLQLDKEAVLKVIDKKVKEVELFSKKEVDALNADIAFGYNLALKEIKEELGLEEKT